MQGAGGGSTAAIVVCMDAAAATGSPLTARRRNLKVRCHGELVSVRECVHSVFCSLCHVVVQDKDHEINERQKDARKEGEHTLSDDQNESIANNQNNILK